jgi:adenosylcobyric acid synthase
VRGGSLLVAGTASDAGKSLLTAGICRWLARQGVAVAPFKAQNMSNNSMVTPGGAEIGRAQAMQAAAAGVAPEAVMNPVLLKPGSDHRSQVVVLGQPAGDADAADYWGEGPGWRGSLLEVVLGAYDDLRSRFDVVICEGAGSPAEINLRARDIVNLGLARARRIPVVVVGDIDRGGVFAALYGTVALLEAADQELVCGLIVNKFRGDPAVLKPGLDQITALTGRPVLGVVPYLDGVWLDSEDTLNPADRHSAGTGAEPLRIAVVRLPRISNFTDIDALCLEPGVVLNFTATPADVAVADLVILPGTKSTVADLAWLRSMGLAEALAKRVARGGPVLGVCGGYQMLGELIEDDFESGAGRVAGLGLLPVKTRFAPVKTLGRPTGYSLREPVSAYEIHHGRVEVTGGEAWFSSAPDGGAALDGCRSGPVSGTLWHGIFENDSFRRAFLTEIARRAGRDFRPAADVCFAAARQAVFDRLADAVEACLDTALLWRLIEHGPAPGLPGLPPGVGA